MGDLITEEQFKSDFVKRFDKKLLDSLTEFGVQFLHKSIKLFKNYDFDINLIQESLKEIAPSTLSDKVYDDIIEWYEGYSDQLHRDKKLKNTLFNRSIQAISVQRKQLEVNNKSADTPNKDRKEELKVTILKKEDSKPLVHSQLKIIPKDKTLLKSGRNQEEEPEPRKQVKRNQDQFEMMFAAFATLAAASVAMQQQTKEKEKCKYYPNCLNASCIYMHPQMPDLFFNHILVQVLPTLQARIIMHLQAPALQTRSQLLKHVVWVRTPQGFVFRLDQHQRPPQPKHLLRDVLNLIISKFICILMHRHFYRTLFGQFYGFSQKSIVGFKEVAKDYTTKIEVVKNFQKLKIFRVIDLQGDVVAKEYEKVPKDTLNRIFELMVRVEEMDSILYMSQRQGKISFYMTSFGETATTVATAAALKDHDLIFPQYREQGSFMWRGFTIENIINQCMGNVKDLGKGRQMPVHYGSKELNIVTVSSPLTTQVPQASGAGYGFRIAGEDRIAVTYFGEGAASEGDFHSAMNFAATLKSQTLFICRNNHYAISTPIEDQFTGDTIAGKGPSYGMRTLKVDGNDALAVYMAVQYAREQIIKHKDPFLIEFITYRVGDHSTSDHSVLYREQEEIDSWKKLNNPINRLGLYLKKSGFRHFSEEDDKQLRKEVKDEIIKQLKIASEQKLPPIKDLFTDVYHDVPKHLQEQQKELLEHLEKYQDKYDLSKYHQ